MGYETGGIMEYKVIHNTESHDSILDSKGTQNYESHKTSRDSESQPARK